jgi:hypothetical protein
LVTALRHLHEDDAYVEADSRRVHRIDTNRGRVPMRDHRARIVVMAASRSGVALVHFPDQ